MNQQPQKMSPPSDPIGTADANGDVRLNTQTWKLLNQIANNSVGQQGAISDEYLEIFILNEIDWASRG